MANQRKIYLINTKFQLRFSLYICIILSVATIIYPYTIYELMEKTIELASSFSQVQVSKIKESRSELTYILVLWQLGFTGLIFILGIYFSHKIAGPIYKLRKYLDKVKEGQYPGKLTFRKGDYFQEVAADFNETIEAIHTNHRNDFEYLTEVNSYINNLNLVVPEDKKVVLAEISKKLTEIQERYKG